MNPTPLAEEALENATAAEIHSALFAQFVTGHAQMTMMLLGKYPNPQTGRIEPAVPEAAKLFLDQLEMIEAKTKGNLNVEEARLLGQMLRLTQKTFAEVIDSQVGGDDSDGMGSAPTPGANT